MALIFVNAKTFFCKLFKTFVAPGKFEVVWVLGFMILIVYYASNIMSNELLLKITYFFSK